ncbi:hypothetical protein JFQ90_003996 [Aeromonas veronii]|nr:hypothetical protein [Aeromonas veronii]
MNGLKKQRGAVELYALILLAVIGVFMYTANQIFDRYREMNEIDVAKKTFNMWVAAAMNYREDKGGWPTNSSQLLGVYMNNVPSAINTPWGAPYQVSIAPGDMIEVSVDAKDRKKAGRMASGIPQSTITGNIVTARYGKPGSEPALSAFLKKDGSTPLEGEWNVGGYGIGNVKDITISGMDNRTVLSGLSYNNVQQNSQYVNLVNCPPGRANRKITVVPLTYSKNGYPFRQMGAVEGRWDGARAFVRVWETEQNGSQYWFIPNPASATVLVLQQCTK